jgi:hypothetical protein
MQFLLKALTRVPLPLLYTWSAVDFVHFASAWRRRDRAELDIANAFPARRG